MKTESVIIGLLVVGGIYLLYKSTLNVTAAAATNSASDAVAANVTGGIAGLEADFTALINVATGNFSQAQ